MIRRTPTCGGLAAIVLIAYCRIALAADAPTGWSAVPQILSRIQAPQFPNRDFPITEHGATRGGQTDCRPAISQAIAACHGAGGGRVVVPAGDWLVRGPIHLRSNVNLHLEEGATIRFSNEPSDYLAAGAHAIRK